MLDHLSAIDKVSLFAIGKLIGCTEQCDSIARLAERFSVPLMSEARHRARLLDRISNKELPASSPAEDQITLPLAKTLIEALLSEANAWNENKSRRSYAGWLKRLLTDQHDAGYQYENIAALTGISVETIKGFKDSLVTLSAKESVDERHQAIARLWREASHKQRQSLDRFWLLVGRKLPDLSIARDEMRSILINLGLHTPRGPKIKNEGTQVKKPFAPHALWEGDGKLLKISINGQRHDFCWYAFVDQTTTLLVGSSITATESSAAFLDSLRDGKQRYGTYSIGILIDNRLPDSDLSAVKEFCDNHGIVIARTFPGNARTNGLIEGNFSVFERFVGSININGYNEAAIAKSIAQAIIEVFTQQRNHSKRNRLGGATPDEAGSHRLRPENVRSAIERLANRLNHEQTDALAKWQLIEPSRRHFGMLLEESEEKMKRQLVKYQASDIVAAQAAYLAQLEKHPDRRYGSEYFFAILRYQVEERSKETFTEAFRAGHKHWSELVPWDAKENAAESIIEELAACANDPIPVQRLLRLDALTWWLIAYAQRASLPTLWIRIERLAIASIRISERWWMQVVRYVHDRIGGFMYSTAPDSASLFKHPSRCRENLNWEASTSGL